MMRPCWRSVQVAAVRLFNRGRQPATEVPEEAAQQVLILTPVKDAAHVLPRYWELLYRLTYPHQSISLGFLEGDSSDRSYDLLRWKIPALQREFRRALLWKRDFGFNLPTGVHRHEEAIQVERRAVIARARNHLLFHALDNEHWVLWIDADLFDYPPDIIDRLLAVGKDIVQPHCVIEYGGPTFDCNAWVDHGRYHMESFRDRDLVQLDAVGGTMLLVKADLHRDGLVFPPFPYGKENKRIRPGHGGEIETEGLGVMAYDMGTECWGLPNLEIRHHPF